MSHITTVTHHDSRGSGGVPASRRRLRHIGAVLAGSIVLGALLLVLANLAFAQSAKKKAPSNLKPFLVEDIYPGKTGSEPNYLVDFKGKLLFAAMHPDFGEELWRSNGTRSGTRLVKDIDPGPLVVNKAQNTETGSSVPDSVLRTKKSIYFQATTVKYGEELWKSDGTAKGTTLVKDINTVKGNSNPNDKGDAINRSAEVEKLFVVGKTLYFRASDGKHGVELWKTDGTESGTKLVKDINPAAPAPINTACKRRKSCVGSSWVDAMTRVGKTLYFTAKDGKHGLELWKSDGTNRGTKLVKNINPSSASDASDISNLVAMGNRLYFTANDGKHGLELWKSDGTVKGTREVKDIKPGKIGSNPDSLTAFGGVLIFAAADGKDGPELWGSDGTWAGTTLLGDLAPGAIGSEPGELTTSGRFLYFAASTPSAGEELWAVQSKGISK